jgi:3-hydroxybutyryl-CoA dehydrogenase
MTTGPGASVARVGVVGAGTMGAGIAQLAALAGLPTLLFDPDPGALATGADRVEGALAKGAGRGLWSAAEAADAAAMLGTATAFDQLAGADLVIEAAPEDLELKRELFVRLEGICAEDALLATNTSSLPVAEVGAALTHPQRFCGMHFFNPPALMKLVEVVAAPDSAPQTLEEVELVARAMGREPVRAADSPGFIVNRCNRPYTLEALRMLGEGVASHAEIDTAMRERGGYRMGPFELIDLIGVDVNLEVARSFYAQRHEPRWEPHPIQAELVEAGRLGRKSGTGFYEYRDGRRVEPEGGGPLPDAEADAIVERIVAGLVNEASFAVGEGVARAEDVDTAMRLGLNHPRGPFEWRDSLGADRLLGLLEELGERLGEPERYRPAPLLVEAAQASGGV